MPSQKVNTYFGASNVGTALTITLASLASSTAGVGRQATEIDLTGLATADKLPEFVTFFFKFTQGANPTASKAAYFHYLNSDGTHRDGAAGASDAGYTIAPNLTPIHVAANKASPATGDVLQGSFRVRVESPRFIIAVYHDTGVALDSTAGNHYIQYIVSKPDLQAAA